GSKLIEKVFREKCDPKLSASHRSMARTVHTGASSLSRVNTSLISSSASSMSQITLLSKRNRPQSCYLGGSRICSTSTTQQRQEVNLLRRRNEPATATTTTLTMSRVDSPTGSVKSIIINNRSDNKFDYDDDDDALSLADSSKENEFDH